MISQLPQTPNVGNEVPNTLWKWLVEIGNRIRALITWVNDYSVAAHASTHATGGSDPIAPADIGAVTQEAGTFTPRLAGYTTEGTPTHTRQIGRYKKIGNVVHFNLSVAISSKTGMTGSVIIKGLPFAADANSRQFPVTVSEPYGFTFTSGYTTMHGKIYGGLSFVELEQSQAGTTYDVINSTNLGSTAYISISGTYFV